MSLNRLDVLRGLRLSTWEAVWTTVWMVLTTGAFQTGFALYLGASPFWLGLLAGLPSAVGLLQLPASLYIERRGERKRFVTFCAVGGRVLWLPILLTPFVLPPSLWMPSFVFFMALSSALITVTVPAWTSWMSDLVPADNRGRYFGQRSMLAGIVAMLVPLPAGAFLDQAVKYGRFDPRLGFGVLFALAVGAALVGGAFLLRQPEPPMEKRDAGNPLASLSAPLSDTNFRRFIAFAGLGVAGQTLASQFFTAWQVDRAALNLPYLTVQALGATASAASLAAMPLWGFLADRYGNRPVLAMAAGGVVLSPLLWMLTVPRADALWFNIGLIVTLNVISGAFWAGYGLSQFNLLVGLAPAATRGTYVAVFSALTGLVGGIAPILGGALMTALEPVALSLGPLTLNNYKILFGLTALIRVACLFLIGRVTEPEGRSTRYVLDQLRQSRPVTSWLTLRRLSRPSRESERHRAIGKLADLRSPLAVEELVTALEDVSPAVREGAARALGEIGDARALPALIARLHDPAAGLGDIAAEALSRIGDRAAVPPLMEAAAGPDATVRLAALRALGRLADPRAVPTLLAAIDPAHPATSEAACEALTATAATLSEHDARQAAAPLLPLLAGGTPRGLRLAAARALESLARHGPSASVYKAVKDAVQNETDPAVAGQAAAALSRLGAAAGDGIAARLMSLLPVLDTTAASPLAYKQTLAAVAHLGLPDGAFYPYLSLPDLARDEAMNKLLEEVRRRLRASTPAAPERGSLRLDRRVAQALEAYTAGEYAACLHALARVARQLPPHDEPATSAAAVLDALARRAEEKARRGPAHTAARPEEALLGALLFRAALH